MPLLIDPPSVSCRDSALSPFRLQQPPLPPPPLSSSSSPPLRRAPFATARYHNEDSRGRDARKVTGARCGSGELAAVLAHTPFAPHPSPCPRSLSLSLARVFSLSLPPSSRWRAYGVESLSLSLARAEIRRAGIRENPPPVAGAELSRPSRSSPQHTTQPIHPRLGLSPRPFSTPGSAAPSSAPPLRRSSSHPRSSSAFSPLSLSLALTFSLPPPSPSHYSRFSFRVFSSPVFSITATAPSVLSISNEPPFR